MGNFIDITGARYGKLVVIQREKPNPSYNGAMWLCKCDCGNMTIANGQNLKSGNTSSCGCLGFEKRRRSATTHGKSGTRIHRIWKAMHTRCLNKNSIPYKYYGGRGITICDLWAQNFEAFYTWAIENGYSDTLTIDRIDNNKGYSPENCRWVTMAEQNQNKRATNGYKIKEI